MYGFKSLAKFLRSPSTAKCRPREFWARKVLVGNDLSHLGKTSEINAFVEPTVQARVQEKLWCSAQVTK